MISLKPKHTADSVGRRLIAGLQDGTIDLERSTESLPTEFELLRTQVNMQSRTVSFRIALLAMLALLAMPIVIVFAGSVVDTRLKKELKSTQLALEKTQQALEKAQQVASATALTVKTSNRVIRNLNSAMEILAGRVHDNNVKMHAIVTGDSESEYSLKILGSMTTNARFRDEMLRTMSGRLIINNRTDRNQALYVNGTLWKVAPNSSFVWVRHGPVMIRSPKSKRSELLTNWQYNPKTEDFTLHFDLRDDDGDYDFPKHVPATWVNTTDETNLD